LVSSLVAREKKKKGVYVNLPRIEERCVFVIFVESRLCT